MQERQIEANLPENMLAIGVAVTNKEKIETLVRICDVYIPEIQKNHPDIYLNLKNESGMHSDLFGWTLRTGWIDRNDGDFVIGSLLIEIAELEINDGNPKMKIIHFRNEKNEIDSKMFPINRDIEPGFIVTYLHHVLMTGDPFVKIDTPNHDDDEELN